MLNVTGPKNTVNYRGVSRQEHPTARSAAEAVSVYITFGYHRRPSGQNTGVQAGARILELMLIVGSAGLLDLDVIAG